LSSGVRRGGRPSFETYPHTCHTNPSHLPFSVKIYPSLCHFGLYYANAVSFNSGMGAKLARQREACRNEVKQESPADAVKPARRKSMQNCSN